MVNQTGAESLEYGARRTMFDYGLNRLQHEQATAGVAQEIDQLLQIVRQILRQPLQSEFGPGELTGPQRSVMQALLPSEGLSLKELSKKVGLAHSTVSGIVDRLATRGLVRRLVEDSDRRLSRIVVTEQVQEFVQSQVPGSSLSPLIAAMARATPDDQAVILNGLRKLRILLTPERALAKTP